MVSMPQAGRGRTVYSGGSFAPTRGPVTGQGVQGYLKRSARQNNAGMWGGSSKWGNDGKSDTRSGVAQRALQRQGGWGSNDWKKHYPGGGPGQGGGGGGGNATGPNGEPAQPGSGIQTGEAGNAAPANVPSVSTPTVVVGDAGKLELPYDPSYGADVYDALKGSNDEIAGVQAEEQAQGALYAQQQHLQEQQYAGQKVKTLNRGGASGNLFSSGQGMAVASDATMNQNALNQYANENTQAMTGLATQKTGIQNAFRQFLSNRTLQYGDDLSEDAGEIGFGQDEPGAGDFGTTLPKYPGRKNKPKPPKAKPKPPAPTGHKPPPKPGQSPPNRPPQPGKRNR